MVYAFMSPLMTSIHSMVNVFDIFEQYMYKLGPKGLAIYLKDVMLKNDIEGIYLVPDIKNNHFVLKTKVYCIDELSLIQIGILKDFIESELAYRVTSYMKENKIDITVYNEPTFYLKECLKSTTHDLKRSELARAQIG